MTLELGTILDDKYRIVRLIGEGAMGSVYEGENTLIKRSVAIKVLHANIKRREEHAKRFEREARAAGQIGSEHIVSVIDFGDLPDGHTFMVMEYLEGEDLGERIERCGRLGAEELFPLILQLLAGVHEAHLAGIIHRDLKPENVFITRRQDEEFVKILDFGVSKFQPLDISSAVTQAGQLVGTPHFMSPEQARGRPLDPRADVYAVGAVMFTALAGTMPFEARSFNDLIFRIVMESPRELEELVEGIDPEVVAIVKKAMARDRDDRHADALDLAGEVGAWLRTRGVAVPSWVPPPSPPASTPPPSLPPSDPPSAPPPRGPVSTPPAAGATTERPSSPPSTTAPSLPPAATAIAGQPRRTRIAVAAIASVVAVAAVAWLAGGSSSPSSSALSATATHAQPLATTTGDLGDAPGAGSALAAAAATGSSVAGPTAAAPSATPSATHAQPEPAASQPEPAASQPQPAASQPQPTSSQPADTPPADTPPTDTPPADSPPTDSPPADTPPTDSPPTDSPPAEPLPPADDTAEPAPSAPPAPSTSGRRVYEQL